MLGLAASSASAAELLGRVDKWSPHGEAPVSGWTKVKASKNLGFMEWGPSKAFRAKNNQTVFRQQSDSGTAVKISRNKFFRVLGSYHGYISMSWKWRGPQGHRYRYIVSICAIRAGG